MFYHFLCIGVLLISAKFQNQVLAKDSSTYTAAVVEYYPVTGTNAEDVAERNANNYVKIIQKASNHDVDIIVFAEFGLTSLPKVGDRDIQFIETEFRNYYRHAASHVPNPSKTMSLCNLKSNKIYKKSLQLISCAAKKYNMYVIVNHHERLDCNPQKEINCPTDGFLLYNTNIVFNRLGEVIARYRKSNLWKEDGTSVTTEPQLAIFETDFGVTFGQLICADIASSGMPAMYYVKNPNVTDIIFTTHWFDSMLPFHHGTQYFASWAYGTGKNLLASAYDGGSGIFLGKNGPVEFKQLDQTAHALIVAEIPKHNHENHLQTNRNFKSSVHRIEQTELPTVMNTSLITSNALKFPNLKEDLTSYKTKLLDPKKNFHGNVCDGDFCCHFDIKMNYDEELAAKFESKHYMYRLIVYNNVASFNPAIPFMAVENCALVACAGKDLEDCCSFYPEGTEVVKPITFEYIAITRHADLTKNALYVPSTLTQSLEPMRIQDFAYKIDGHKAASLLFMHLHKPKNDIIIFGIHGRRYDKDGEEPIHNNHNTINSDMEKDNPMSFFITGLISAYPLKFYLTKGIRRIFG